MTAVDTLAVDTSATVDRRFLVAAFKALDLFTSTDKTRAHLARIMVTHLEGANPLTRLEATDGHRLMRLDVKGAPILDAGPYDVKPGLARLKAQLLPKPTVTDCAWPNTSQVIPARLSEPGPIALASYNPSYMAEAFKAFELLGCATVRLQPSVDLYAPIRLDGTGTLETGQPFEVLALVMPMRA